MLEVDPDVAEGEWLRKYAQSSAVHLNQPFPDGGQFYPPHISVHIL